MITYPLNNIDYTAEDAELFHCTRTSGIWADGSFSITATGNNNDVTIGKGIAWINNEEFSGKVVALKSAKTIDLGIADGVYPRIDVIAIQFNSNKNETDVVVKKGVPATNPTRPAIVRTGAVYELYLASVYRAAGSTAITVNNITDLRMDSTVCGLMADSVTNVDMDAIHAQLMGLVADLESAIQNIEVGEVVPIEKGGTNAQTSAGARQNLNFIGVDPISSLEEDTPAKWIELGSGVALITGNTTENLANKPNNAGFVLNIVSSTFANQLFLSQQGHLRTYKRAGSLTSGWYNSGAWKEVLDEQNGVQIEKAWENASPNSVLPVQNLTIDWGDEYDLFLIEAKMTVGTAYRTFAFAKKGVNTTINAIGGITVSGLMVVYSRAFVIGTNRLEIKAGYKKQMSGTEVAKENDEAVIPLVIYGIKGVQ
jgi:hypothetical protein